MTSSSKQALAALNDLFSPPVSLPPDTPVFDRPTNLDELIERDFFAIQAEPLEVPLWRWFKGEDIAGIKHVFRFSRGGSISAWIDTLNSHRLVAVTGPFRNQAQATN